MALYPHVQEEAQKEIDRVIGSNRMPTWSDRADLPYVRAVVEETLRCECCPHIPWQDSPSLTSRPSNTGMPVTLIGPPMPHALSKTESYLGYTLPAGAAIVNCVCYTLLPCA